MNDKKIYEQTPYDETVIEQFKMYLTNNIPINVNDYSPLPDNSIDSNDLSIVDYHQDYIETALSDIDLLFEHILAEPLPYPMYKLMLKNLMRMQYRWYVSLCEEPADMLHHIKAVVTSSSSLWDMIHATQKAAFADELLAFLKSYKIPDVAFK